MSDQLEQLSGDDRELVAVALQALHRERVTAYLAAGTACDLAGVEPPRRVLFGITEVSVALGRIGAAMPLEQRAMADDSSANE